MTNKITNLLNKTSKHLESFLNTLMVFYADYFKHNYHM